jgi:hypothetical protein
MEKEECRCISSNSLYRCKWWTSRTGCFIRGRRTPNIRWIGSCFVYWAGLDTLEIKLSGPFRKSNFFLPSGEKPPHCADSALLFRLCCFLLPGARAPSGLGPPQTEGFIITVRHTTLGTTPLEEWLAQRRDLSLTTYKRQTTTLIGGIRNRNQQGSCRRPMH